MITPNDFHENLVIEDNGQILQIISYQHHRKSQSRAKVLAKMRNVDTGSIVEKNYPSDTKLREVDVRKKDFQYLYSDGEHFYFMDNESYHQEQLTKDHFGDSAKFLVENMEVIGVYFDDKFRDIEMPANIVAKVSTTEPGVKGDSVSNITKNATLETGIEVKVPLFIKEGDQIRVDTRTGQYVERVTS